MTARSLPDRIVGLLFSLLSAAMMALAAGATWLLAWLYLDRNVDWLALPLGLILGWVARVAITRSRSLAAVLGAFATVLATVYMLALRGAMEIASMMGIPFAVALREAGTAMLLQLAQLALPALALPMLLATLLAAWAGYGRRRH